MAMRLASLYGDTVSDAVRRDMLVAADTVKLDNFEGSANNV